MATIDNNMTDRIPVTKPPDAQLLEDLVVLWDIIKDMRHLVDVPEEAAEKLATIEKRWNIDPVFTLPGGKA